MCKKMFKIKNIDLGKNVAKFRILTPPGGGVTRMSQGNFPTNPFHMHVGQVVKRRPLLYVIDPQPHPLRYGQIVDQTFLLNVFFHEIYEYLNIFLTFCIAFFSTSNVSLCLFFLSSTSIFLHFSFFKLAKLHLCAKFFLAPIPFSIKY